MTKTLKGLSGGSEETYYSVVDEALGTHTSYRRDKSWSQCEDLDEFLAQPKDEIQEECLVLTVTGNAVSCESALREMGLRAYAVGPNRVHVLDQDLAS